MEDMSLNIDFVAIISLITVDVIAIIVLAIYLGFTYSWDASTKQEEEAQQQFHEMRAYLLRKQGANITQDNQDELDSMKGGDNTFGQNLSGGGAGTNQTLFNITAIAPNTSNIQGTSNKNVRQLQRNFMTDSVNSSTGGASRGNESREDDDNFRAANGGQEADDDDIDEEDFFNM